VDFWAVVVEPLPGYGGQVYDFVHAHGNGVQHIAFRTADIVETMNQIPDVPRIRFSPDAWESTLNQAALLFPLDEELFQQIRDRREKRVLMDLKPNSNAKKGYGTLSQVFTAQAETNGFGFFEIIERRDYDGFAALNIGALFKGKETALSVLFVDEILGKDAYLQWQNASAKNVSLVHLNFTTKTQLVQYLKHTLKKFDVIVSSFVPIDAEVIELLQVKPMIIQAQVLALYCRVLVVTIWITVIAKKTRFWFGPMVDGVQQK
jgi:hypothetical protein